MSRRAFEDGAIIHVDGMNGIRKVKWGIPDSDHEIKVYNESQTDWTYVNVERCSLAHQNVAPTHAEPCTGEATQPNQEAGISAMANTNRSIVKVVLIDQDAGLDPSKALVKDFGEHVLEGSQEDLKMQIVMSSDTNMESILRAHNEMRGKEVDLDIRQRTGNEVKLAPRKLHELTWKIGTVA